MCDITLTSQAQPGRIVFVSYDYRKIIATLGKGLHRIATDGLHLPHLNKHKAISQFVVGIFGMLVFAPSLSAASLPAGPAVKPAARDIILESAAERVLQESAVISSATEQIEELEQPQLVWPTTTYRISRGVSGSGTISNGRVSKSAGHTGVDIDCETGDEIFSMMDGTVIVASSGGPFGNKVMIDHGDGLKSMYAHLNTMSTTAGAEVLAGESIGTCGATGNSSGDHLHWEMYFNNVVINPTDYFKQKLKETVHQ